MAIAVMMVNMGGPESLESVEPYLKNIFSDPDIIDIPFPGFIRKRFSEWMAAKRAPKSREIYEKLNGSTPLTKISFDQAKALETILNSEVTGQFKTFTAMRYWQPLMEDVWSKITADKFENVIILSMYPFYSSTTTGSIKKLINRLNSNGDFSAEDLIFIDRYGENSGFIQAMAKKINQTIIEKGFENRDNINLLCSAHSIPLKRIRQGDPYQEEVESAFDSLKRELLPNITATLGYQSKIGPVKWLGPKSSDQIINLSKKDFKDLFVYPLGFVADNSETIYEIGMLFKDLAKEHGIEKYYRIDSLNTDENFIACLKEIILQKLSTQELKDENG